MVLLMGGLWSLSCMNHIHNVSSVISSSDFIKMEWKLKTRSKQSKCKILVLNDRLADWLLFPFCLPHSNLTALNIVYNETSNTQCVNKKYVYHLRNKNITNTDV